MIRFKVERGLVKYKGKVYYQGDLLPVNFTEREKARQVYSRRLIQVEVPDEPSELLLGPIAAAPVQENTLPIVETAEPDGTEEIPLGDEEENNTVELPEKEEIADVQPSVIKHPGTQASTRRAPIIKK